MKRLKNRDAAKTQEFFKYYPDPAIFIIDLRDTNKKLIFLHITFWRYIYIIFQR